MRILTKFGLYIVSIPLLSRVYGWMTRRTRPRFLVRKIIKFFIKTYGISMKNFSGDIQDYNSLNEIFLRKLNPKTRPLKKKTGFIVSPADGTVSHLELVREEKAFQVKGVDYDLSELINDKPDFSRGWYVITIYLSPKDYHRFHFPASGKLKSYCHMQGRLYPVNSLGLNHIKALFEKNERIVVKTEIEDYELYIVAVGATFVGSIKMEFIEKYRRDNLWKEIDMRVSQLDEMGRFELGSTIVMLVPEGLADPLISGDGKHIEVGDNLFKINRKANKGYIS